MFCSKCGKQIDDNVKFCPECGEPQFGQQRPDSEFRMWLRQRRMAFTVIGAVLVVFGVVIKSPQLTMVGAVISTVSLMALEKLNK